MNRTWAAGSGDHRDGSGDFLRKGSENLEEPQVYATDDPRDDEVHDPTQEYFDTWDAEHPPLGRAELKERSSKFQQAIFQKLGMLGEDGLSSQNTFMNELRAKDGD